MKTTRETTPRRPYPAQGLQLAAVAVLLTMATCGRLLGSQLVLQHSWTRYPDGGRYYDAADSWMQEGLKSSNHGDETFLKAEYHDGLGDSTVLRFGLPLLTHEGVTAATLSLFYYDNYNMGSSEWLQIRPYRTTAAWAEMGVTYKHRDKNASPELYWTGEDWAGWYDKADDGNETKQLKRQDGDPPEGIGMNHWVDFNVLPTVALWDAGTVNNGFGVYEYASNDNLCGAIFYANQYEGAWSQHPKLTVTYWRGRISWCGFSGSTWDTSSGNWNVGGLVGIYGDGDLVTFADGASNPAIAVTGGGVSPGSVIVSNNSTAYTFSGGSIGGSGTFTKSGSGTATLMATNGYSGVTLVKNGVLVVATNNALGAIGSGTVVSNGAALAFQGGVNYASAEPVTVSGGGGGGGVLYAVSGNNTFAGPVTLAANSTVGVNTALGLSLYGAIGGGFSFTKTGAGTLTFGGSDANTYGGATYVNQGMLSLVKSTGTAVPNDLVIGDGVNAATVRLGAQGQLCSACDVTVLTSGQLDLNHHSSTIGSLTLSNGTVTTGSGTLALGGPVSSTGNQGSTISGKLNLGGSQREFNVANGTAADDLVASAEISSGGINKTGAGRLLLSTNSTFDGEVVISNGVLTATASAALGTQLGGTTVAGGARLELRNNVALVREPLTLNGAGSGLGALDNASDTNVWGGPVTLGSDSTIECDSGRLSLASIAAAGFALTFNTSGDILVNGAISGSGSRFTKSGGGVLNLGGLAPHTYSGVTFLGQGTLALSALGSIPNTPIIDVAAGAILDVTGLTEAFALAPGQTLKGSGTVSGSVVTKSLARLEPGESPGTLTFLNNLILAEGVTNYFELTNSLAVGGGINDLIIVGGDLALHGNIIAITVLGSSPLGSGSYRLFNYAGAKTGSFDPTPVFLSGAPGPGSTAWIDESVTNQVSLVVVTPISTFTSVSSAPNPSLPGVNVALTATVSSVPPATNVPAGSVTFKTNSVPLGPAAPLVNGIATLNTTGLAHGFTTVFAEYPGTGQFLGSTGSVVQLVNTPPVPGYHIAYVMENEELSLPVMALLANDHDPDGDALNIVQVSSLSTNGGTAALLGITRIACLPKPDYVGADLLTYTLADPYTNVTVPLYIRVLSTSDLTNCIVGITNQGAGVVALTATGIPGFTYWVQAVTNLIPPYFWETLSTNIADTNGLFQFTDLGATNAEAYYRSATPTNAPDFQMYDTELLRLDVAGGGPLTGVMIRESPTLVSAGMTRIEQQITGLATISSFFDVFTELSVDHGVVWLPATNGCLPLILTGGSPLNQFPAETLPPPAGQYISPPEWPAGYPQGVLIKDFTLRGFSGTFLPPAPGETKVYNFAATLDMWVSHNGGQLFQPYSAPCNVMMRIAGRLMEP